MSPAAALKYVCVFAVAGIVGLAAGALATGRTLEFPASLLATADVSSQASSKSSPWDETFFPNVPVKTHDGRTLRFYDDLIRGKMVVINFIYTSCSNICPLVTSRLALLREALGARAGRDIFFVSITIDPLKDTPDVLKTYAHTYRADSAWTFITGEPQHMDAIRARLGERSNVKAEHRNDIMIGNDRTGTWGRDSAFSNVEILAETVLSFDPDWKKPRPTLQAASLVTDYNLQDKPGTFLFAKACSGCHSIGYGDVVGPDLKGVLDRRDHGWLRRYLREPDRLRHEGDTLAVTLDAKYPGARMPNLNLSDSDVDDLIAYLAAHGGGDVQPLADTQADQQR